MTEERVQCPAGCNVYLGCPNCQGEGWVTPEEAANYGKVVIPPDAKLELPVQGIAVQVGDEIVLEDGFLEFLYMPIHKACVVTLRVNEKAHASVTLDGPLFAVLAAFTADPTRTPLPGTVFKG